MAQLLSVPRLAETGWSLATTSFSKTSLVGSIVDDRMPNPSQGVFHTWLLGSGALRWGQASPRVPTETDRKPDSGNGGGQEILHSRVEWSIHPTGHAYSGTPPQGGPSNGTGSNDLNNADSWDRVFPERKQIPIARLITRES